MLNSTKFQQQKILLSGNCCRIKVLLTALLLQMMLPMCKLWAMTKCQAALQSTACSLHHNPLWQHIIFQTPTPCKPDTSSEHQRTILQRFLSPHSDSSQILKWRILPVTCAQIHHLLLHLHLWSLTWVCELYFTLILQECRWLHWPGRAEVDAGIDRRGNYWGWHRGADERWGQEQRRQNRLRWWEVWTVFNHRQRHELRNKLLSS